MLMQRHWNRRLQVAGAGSSARIYILEFAADKDRSLYFWYAVIFINRVLTVEPSHLMRLCLHSGCKSQSTTMMKT